MQFPTFINVQFVDKNGYLTEPMRAYNDELYRVLINGLSNNGWTLPSVTADQLTDIEGSMPDGTIWYESTNHEVVVKVNGALRKITTTAYP